MPVFRFVGPRSRPALLRLFDLAAAQRLKAPLDLIHELVDKSLETLIVVQAIIEHLLKQLFTYDFVAFGCLQFLAQGGYVLIGDRPQPDDAGTQQGPRFGQIEIDVLMI